MDFKTIESFRKALRSQSDRVFVDRNEFTNLLTSRRVLIRADEPSANLHGLLEPTRGLRFMIEDERLFPRS